MDLDSRHARARPSTHRPTSPSALEEEFALLDAGDLGLTARFEELRDAASADPVLADSVAGELIASEIEIRSGRGDGPGRGDRGPARPAPAAVRARGRSAGSRSAPPARTRGLTTASSTSSTPTTTAGSRTASSTSPGATTRSRCTFTWASAAPTGPCWCATGCGRCCRCCWRSRRTRRSSTGATPGCTARAPRPSPRAFRAAGCPMRSGAGTRSREYIDFLVRTRSIVEYTQVWWSVRPHFSFGTVEVRICDAQMHRDGVRGAGGADRRLRRPGRARHRRRRPVRGPAGAADRGERVAGDPLRARRRAARPRARRAVPGRRETLERLLSWCGSGLRRARDRRRAAASATAPSASGG